MDLDNPAARLHRLLVDLKDLGEAEPSPPNVPLHEAWRRVLGLGPESGPLVLLWQLGEVVRLPDQICSEVLRIDEAYVNRDLILRWEPAVMAVMRHSAVFSTHLSDALGSYDHVDLLALEMCADALHRWRREQVIGEEELRQLKDSLEVLEQEITSAEIPAELRGFLLAHIAEMARALSDYQLRGIVGIRDAFDRLVGAFVRRPDLIPDPESHGGWAEKFKDFMSQVAIILAVVSGLAQLPGQVRDMLDPGQSPPPVTVVLPAPSSPDGHQEPPIPAAP